MEDDNFQVGADPIAFIGFVKPPLLLQELSLQGAIAGCVKNTQRSN
jgi:hypothetical protein